MIAQYPSLAVISAIAPSHANRIVRAFGTLLVAIALAFIVFSIALADTEGTFSALPLGFGDARPMLLNTQVFVLVLLRLIRLLHGPRPSLLPDLQPCDDGWRAACSF